MLAVLTLILSIGLADSIDPAMIIPALYFAASPRGARGVAGFACGVFVVNLVGGVAIALGPGRFLLDLVPHPGPPVTHALELVVGGLLLVAAVLVWRLPRQSDQPPGNHERLRHAAPLVGATVALAELPTAVPYFVIIAAVVRVGCRGRSDDRAAGRLSADLPRARPRHLRSHGALVTLPRGVARRIDTRVRRALPEPADRHDPVSDRRRAPRRRDVRDRHDVSAERHGRSLGPCLSAPDTAGPTARAGRRS